VAVVLSRPAVPPTGEQQARELAAGLRCPDCESLSVAESRTAAAAAIRAEIAEQLAAGRSPAEIRQSFVGRYGQWILLEPTSPLIWLAPLVALLAGGAQFAWWLRGARADPAPPSAEPSVGPAERRRVHDELEQLDG
jgi:cytochrome c-type biogenesis protein CcmH/NrfF